jgi:hypothetical protein
MKDQEKKQPQNPDVHDPSQMPHKTPKSLVENPDKQDNPNPGRTNTIDDDPDQTKRKIPVEDKNRGE